MINLVRAEWTKLFTTRVWLGLLLGACLMVGGFAALLTAFAGESQNGQPGPPAVGTAEYDQLAFSVSGNATVLFLILGIIGMTQEYRHRTATPTFLTTPRRGRVIAAKLLAYGLVAVPLTLVVLGVNVLVVLLYAGARGDAPSLAGDNLAYLGETGLAVLVYTVIGVGVGALVRSQVGAIVGALVFLLVVEPILRAIGPVQEIYRWLPGGGLDALTEAVRPFELLEPWQGGLLLLGYGLAAAVLGTLFAVRRDIT